MSTHGYICHHRECNVFVSLCVLFISLCLLSSIFDVWLLTALSVFFFFLSFLSFLNFYLSGSFSISSICTHSLPPAIFSSCVFSLSFLLHSFPVSHCLHLLPLCRVWATGKWWTVPSCLTWTTWWRCASRIGSVCIRTCRSSTGAWWPKAWLKPKTPPRVTLHLKLNPWWETGKPKKERHIMGSREGVWVCLCLEAGVWFFFLQWWLLDISYWSCSSPNQRPKNGVCMCVSECVLVCPCVHPTKPDYGSGREPGPSAAPHFKRTCCTRMFQTKELRNKTENREVVLSNDILSNMSLQVFILLACKAF